MKKNIFKSLGVKCLYDESEVYCIEIRNGFVFAIVETNRGFYPASLFDKDDQRIKPESDLGKKLLELS